MGTRKRNGRIVRHSILALGALGIAILASCAFLVLEGSPAAKSGVQEGDRIVSVDGRRARDMSLDEIRRLFQVEKAARRVQLARGDRIIEVTLTLRKLL